MIRMIESARLKPRQDIAEYRERRCLLFRFFAVFFGISLIIIGIPLDYGVTPYQSKYIAVVVIGRARYGALLWHPSATHNYGNNDGARRTAGGLAL
jgi:hypothetical protein